MKVHRSVKSQLQCFAYLFIQLNTKILGNSFLPEIRHNSCTCHHLMFSMILFLQMAMVSRDYIMTSLDICKNLCLNPTVTGVLIPVLPLTSYSYHSAKSMVVFHKL